MNNIYLDTRELRQQIDALLIQFPELNEDEVLRADTFEAETSLHAVLEQIVSILREAETTRDAIGARINTLLERMNRFDTRREALRSLIQKIIERADLKKVQLPEATLSISFRKPAPIVVDEAALPDEFCKFKRSPDMAKIKEATELPPGVAMSNGKNILSVRNR